MLGCLNAGECTKPSCSPFHRTLSFVWFSRRSPIAIHSPTVRLMSSPASNRHWPYFGLLQSHSTTRPCSSTVSTMLFTGSYPCRNASLLLPITVSLLQNLGAAKPALAHLHFELVLKSHNLLVDSRHEVVRRRAAAAVRQSPSLRTHSRA